MSCYHKPDHSATSSNPVTKLLLSQEKQSSEESETHDTMREESRKGQKIREKHRSNGDLYN